MFVNIYKIVSPQTDKIYIGSTTKKLNIRFNNHTSDYRRHLNGHYRFCSSFEIIKYKDAKIVLIDTVEINTVYEQRVAERYWIQKNRSKAVNRQIPIIDFSDSVIDKINELIKELRVIEA